MIGLERRNFVSWGDKLGLLFSFSTAKKFFPFGAIPTLGIFGKNYRDGKKHFRPFGRSLREFYSRRNFNGTLSNCK
jgi:hypothetical protein